MDIPSAKHPASIDHQRDASRFIFSASSADSSSRRLRSSSRSCNKALGIAVSRPQVGQTEAASSFSVLQNGQGVFIA
jgi:hypothetical protein